MKGKQVINSYFLSVSKIKLQTKTTMPDQSREAEAGCLRSEALAKGWRKVKLGEVLKIRRGASPRPIHDFIRTSGMPWLKIADVTGSDSRFVDSTKEFIKEGGVSKSVVVKPGDLVLSNSATPGIPRFMRITACVHDGWLILEPMNNSIDKQFLYYRLIIDRKKLVSNVTGAIFDNLKTDILRDHQVLLPPITDQKRIADILSAFDDKIELNNKISAVLEQMAQAIFKEWFVNFRFPSHEKAESRSERSSTTGIKMVDSELGKIPEGWEVKSLDEIANFLNGLALQKYRPSNDIDVLPVIKIREMNNGIDKNTELASSSIDEKYKVKTGDILFSWSGSLELMRWTERVGALNQHLFKVTSKDYPDWFIFYWIQKHLPFFRVIAIGKATSMGHIQRRHLSEAQVIVPSSGIITKADEIISPMFKNILGLRLENQKLAALRDLLLPKLMRGM